MENFSSLFAISTPKTVAYQLIFFIIYSFNDKWEILVEINYLDYQLKALEMCRFLNVFDFELN